MPWWLIGMLGWITVDILFLVVYAQLRRRESHAQDNADGDEEANLIRLHLRRHPELYGELGLIPKKNIP